MKIAAVVCNVVLFIFAAVVLAVDGLPKARLFAALAVLALLVPLFVAAVLERRSAGALLRGLAALASAVLLGLGVWAVASRPPRLQETAALAYAVLLLLAPLLGLAALLRRRGRSG